MNLDRQGAVALAGGVADRAAEVADADLVVCPPSVYLDAVASTLRGSAVAVGAQNMHHAAKGPFTGEISPAMVLDLGCRYVILGHSERRHIFGETDEAINRKLLAALAVGLIPIVCVGEQLDQREAGQTGAVIRRQFTGSLAGLSAGQVEQVVLAYEPVWAIGTGQVATPEVAEAVHSDLRKLIQDGYNQHVARAVRILYGGSVKPDNACQLLAQPHIDGALVGGASLQADRFIAMAASAVE